MNHDGCGEMSLLDALRAAKSGGQTFNVFLEGRENILMEPAEGEAWCLSLFTDTVTVTATGLLRFEPFMYGVDAVVTDATGSGKRKDGIRVCMPLFSVHSIRDKAGKAYLRWDDE